MYFGVEQISRRDQRFREIVAAGCLAPERTRRVIFLLETLPPEIIEEDVEEDQEKTDESQGEMA